MLHTLHWPEEIRDPGDLSSPAPTTDRELTLAELLMSEMAGVDISDLHDDYAEALNLLVDTLAAGGQAVPPAEPEPPVDLMAAQAIKALWDVMLPFSGYAFNKSHTAGYSPVAYWTAYLKANYPAEYMAALLTSVGRRPGHAQRPHGGGAMVVEGAQVVVGDVRRTTAEVGYEVLCRRHHLRRMTSATTRAGALSPDVLPVAPTPQDATG